MLGCYIVHTKYWQTYSAYHIWDRTNGTGHRDWLGWTSQPDRSPLTGQRETDGQDLTARTGHCDIVREKYIFIKITDFRENDWQNKHFQTHFGKWTFSSEFQLSWSFSLKKNFHDMKFCEISLNFAFRENQKSHCVQPKSLQIFLFSLCLI